MATEMRYLVIKKKNSQEIIYFDYDKIKGYDITPKNRKPFLDCIDVSRIILVQPTLIEKMIKKKIDRHFMKLLKKISLLYEVDDETGTALQEVLNEIEKFRIEVKNKYKDYLEKEQLRLLAKKLSILKKEATLRLQTLIQSNTNQKGGKAR